MATGADGGGDGRADAWTLVTRALLTSANSRWELAQPVNTINTTLEKYSQAFMTNHSAMSTRAKTTWFFANL
jgi:membrane-bound lytic murein transglycosylase B